MQVCLAQGCIRRGQTKPEAIREGLQRVCFRTLKAQRRAGGRLRVPAPGRQVIAGQPEHVAAQRSVEVDAPGLRAGEQIY